MNAQTILAILRIVLPVVTQVVSMLHGKSVAEDSAKKAVDTATPTA